SSLGQSLAMGKSVTRALDQLSYVRAVTQRVGRAEQSQDVYGTNVSEFDVDLKPLNGAQSRRARQAIRTVLDRIPGADFTVNTFLVERIEETVLGRLAPVAVNVYGDDLDVLADKARQIAAVLRGLPGAVDVRQLVQPNAPRLDVRLRRDAMVRWGLHPADVLDTLHTVYGENIVGQVYDRDRVFDVAAILAPKERRVSQVAALPLMNAGGTYVPLGQVARIHMTSGRRQVLHIDGQRVQTVTMNVAGKNVGRFAKAARTAIARQVPMPPGTYLDIHSTAQAQTKARNRLLSSSVIAIVFIVLLLSLVLAQPRNLALIFLNLPFALVGGVLAILALGGTVSMGAMVGFVTLFGITLRNSIMLIAHYEHLVLIEGAPWSMETAVRGAKERLSPILMTALVTAFGLLPLALTREAPGNAIEGPMALVILGGLLTSTALNLLVLPSVALRYGRFAWSGADHEDGDG
ncbi:MAG TPA: efflux RND transporter permease subunit, partial [Gammaproteobacteria bacterium]|nr:efflux RND transporter permease subunit [Gammaproteobacteria bacterium]